MNISCFPRLIVLLPACLLLAACASSPMSRIDSNRAAYESWPIDMRQAVLDHKVVKGMTPEMVTTTLGKPSSVQSRAGRKGEMEEVWIYGGASKSPLKNTNIGIGVGPVMVGGIGGGGGGNYSEYREVTFVGGVVVAGEDAQ